MARARRSTARLALALVGALVLALLAACGEPTTTRPPLKVVATIAPLADWARQVGREYVDVTQLVPTGTNPRDYTLSDRDRAKLAEADVLLYNGLGVEPWLDAAVSVEQARRMAILDLSQFLGVTSGRTPARSLAEAQEAAREAQRNGGLEDDRVSSLLWLDPGPSMAQLAVVLIADTYTRVDEIHLLKYRRNADRYNGSLEDFDNWVKREVRAWPRVSDGQRVAPVMQTVDRSWSYFAQRYGITLRVLEGSDDAVLASTNAPIFVNKFDMLAEHASVLGLRKPDATLDPYAADSYIQMMRTNVNTIADAMRRIAQQEQFRSRRLDHVQ